jgi:hypothetical protein
MSVKRKTTKVRSNATKDAEREITLESNKNNGQDHCILPLYLGRQ